MDDTNYQKLANEIADLQRQVRNLRRWLFFFFGLLVALCILPPNTILSIMGFATFVFVAAFVVSHFTTPSTSKSRETTDA